jgi:hypothetical protein
MLSFVYCVSALRQYHRIVENILRFADADTLIHLAYKVSSVWKDTGFHVIKTSENFRSVGNPYPCGPVEYGEQCDLNSSLRFLEPSDEKFERYDKEVLLILGIKDLLREPRYIWPDICLPEWPAPSEYRKPYQVIWKRHMMNFGDAVLISDN